MAVILIYFRLQCQWLYVFKLLSHQMCNFIVLVQFILRKRTLGGIL